MDANAQLAQREMGQVPISIGTSLALEGAGGIIEEAPVTPAPIISLKPRECWVNLRTLFRNFFNSLDRDTRNRLLPADVVPFLIEELEIIQAAIAKISSFNTKPVLYYCTLQSMVKEFPHAKLKEAKTVNQLFYVDMEKRVCHALIEHLGKESVRLFDVHLKGRHPSAFILTHAPVDLLSHRFFDQLWLLESHTGKIKGRAQWSTKLTGSKGYENIPFNRLSLQIFGDDSTYFYAMSIKVKRFLVDLAKKKRWGPMTSKDKILHDIKFEREPEFEAFARRLFKTSYR